MAVSVDLFSALENQSPTSPAPPPVDGYSSVLGGFPARSMTAHGSDANLTDVFQRVHLSSLRAEEIQLWRTTKQLHLMPLVVLNALFMLFGVVGNSTVCYVSAVRMPRTVLNNFVFSLAIAELFGCILIIPIEITKIMNAYNFDYPKLCKTEKYLCAFIIFFTNCVLIAIATERYQRIVKPHNRHVTMKQFRLTIAGACAFAVVLSIPEAILAGSQTMQSGFGQAVVCSTYSSDNYAGTAFPPLWACFVVVVYVISTAAIGSIYCVIAVTIWRRGKIQTDRRSRPLTPDLNIRRRVKCLCARDHSSLVCAPHFRNHPRSRTSVSESEWKGTSLDRYEKATSLRHSSCSECGFLSPRRASSTDDLQVKVDIHQPGDSLSASPRELVDEDDDRQSSPWFPSYSSVARFLFPGDYGMRKQRLGSGCSGADVQARERKRSSSNSDVSSQSVDFSTCVSNPQERSTNDPKFVHRGANQFCDKTDRDPALRPHQPPGCRSYVSQCQEQSRQQQHPHRKNKERRRFTTLFMNELHQAVTRRRQPQEAEFFDRQGSTEDILSPPALTPMGSIKSRTTGYSRKRTTFIMFVMTITTAASLFPHTVVLLYRLAQPTVDLYLSADASIVFHMAWNSFFISLACHPYVYGFWNGRFKSALLSLFDGCREKTKRIHQIHRENHKMIETTTRCV